MLKQRLCCFLEKCILILTVMPAKCLKKIGTIATKDCKSCVMQKKEHLTTNEGNWQQVSVMIENKKKKSTAQKPSH